MTARIAVLVSGAGSNLGALLDHFTALGASAPGAVVYVASDRAGAGGLTRAAERAIDHEHLDRSGRGDQLLARLADRRIDLIALAGYLRAIPADVTGAWRGRIVNVHPSLLPAFGGPGMYGERVHEAVLKRGVRVTGVTVHFVDEVYDNGPIIEQWPVPVLPGDDVHTLAARVLEVEHRVYPRVVAAVAAGDVTLDATGVVRSAKGEPMDFQFAGVARATFRKGP
jgi:formyltetrahydrofolate-dependent phosphoribosylglycinamide formyltransferase